MNFTAIDFETANPQRNSICQIGLIYIENGAVKKKISLLVKPPENNYKDFFTSIHGIRPEDTEKSPNFKEIWPQIEPYIKNKIVVAHNGFGFDFPTLEKTLAYYDLPIPKYTKKCTYKIYKSKLNILCKQYSIPLNHHDALSDAMACAQLYALHCSNKFLN